MGTTSSSFGTLSVQLEVKNLTAGDTACGCITLNTTARLTGATLYLRFKGRENAFLSQTTLRQVKVGDKMHQERVYSLKKQNSNLIDLRIPVQSWNVLEIGQYMIPVNFLLPKELPASFYVKGHEFLAGIDYHIGAELSFSNNQKDKLKVKEKVYIKSELNRPFKTATQQDSVGLKSCCKSKGRVQLAASIEKDILGIGEKTNLTIDVDNSASDVAVKRVIIRLVQKFELKADNRRVTKEITLSTWLPEDSQLEGPLEIVIPEEYNGDIKEFKGQNDTAIAQKLTHASTPSNKVSLTTQSRLIKSSHFIRVECEMDACCCNNPKVDIPIDIVQEQIYTNFASAPAPTEWHPTVMQTVNLAATPHSVNIGDLYQSDINRDMMGGGMDAYNQMIEDKKNR